MRAVAPLLALILAPLVVAAQDPDTAAPDTASLRFGWPVGMRAHIELERVRVRTAGATPDTNAILVTYDLEVHDHPDGRQIRYLNFASPGLDAPADDQRRLMQMVSSIVPGYVVSDSGELLRVDQLSEVRAAMLGWVRTALDTLPPGGLETLLGEMLSEDVLFALAAQEWNALVGTWIGAELEVGAAYELEAEEPIPMLGNVMVPYRYELGVSARVPCTPGASETGCVELILRSHPDPEAIQPHLTAFVQRMLDAAGPGVTIPPIAYRQLEIETEIVVVSEPATLTPHALTITRMVDATMEIEGVAQTARDAQVARYAYTYR